MIRIFWLAVALTIFNSTIVQADIILQFADSSGLAKSKFDISEVGGTVDVAIYLVETGPSTLIFEEGLFSAAFQLEYSTGGGSSVAVVTKTSDVSFNPIFDLSAPTVTLDTNSVLVDLATSDLAFGIGSTQIKLATIQFTGVSPGELQLRLFDLNGANFVTQNLTSFDNSVLFPSPATLRISAVPEPSSILLMLGSSIGFCIRYRYRRTVFLRARIDTSV